MTRAIPRANIEHWESREEGDWDYFKWWGILSFIVCLEFCHENKMGRNSLEREEIWYFRS